MSQVRLATLLSTTNVGDKKWWQNIDGIINQSLKELSGLAGLSGSLELENSTTEKISAFSQAESLSNFPQYLKKFSVFHFRLAQSIFYETLYENNFIIAFNLFPTDSRQNHLEN